MLKIGKGNHLNKNKIITYVLFAILIYFSNFSIAATSILPVPKNVDATVSGNVIYVTWKYDFDPDVDIDPPIDPGPSPFSLYSVNSSKSPVTSDCGKFCGAIITPLPTSTFNSDIKFEVQISIPNTTLFTTLEHQWSSETYKYPFQGNGPFKFRIRAYTVDAVTDKHTYSNYAETQTISALIKPTISPSTSTITSTQKITISSPENVTYKYKLTQLGQPCTNDNWLNYSNAFTLNSPKRVCAKSERSYSIESVISFSDFNVKLNQPNITPNNEKISEGSYITLASSQGAVIKFKRIEVGQSCSNNSWLSYTSSFQLQKDQRVCAKATKSGWVDSDIFHQDFFLDTGEDEDFISDVPTVQEIDIPNVIQSSTQLTKIEGKASVTNQGGATYNIPFELIEGIAKNTPRIGLTYSSLSNSNLAGLGWSLTGTSTISRCNGTLENDGRFQEVAFNNSDLLCLGSQKLRLVSGSNLTAGAEYRLDKSPEVKILQKNNNNSAYFEVRNGSGSISIFGSNSNSKLLDNRNNKVFSWLLTEKKNAFSQSINYKYLRYTNHIPLLQEVSYSNNRVVFEYESRKHQYLKYFMGNRRDDSYRLKTVQVKNHNNLSVRSYHLKYKQSSFSDKDLLNTIEMCNGNLSGICSLVTSFEYSDEVVAGFSSIESTIDLSNYTSVDGWGDCPETSGDNYCSVYSMQVADMNNDGQKDIIVATRKGNTGKVLVFEYNGNNFEYNSQLSILDGHTYNKNGVGQMIQREFPWYLADTQGNGYFSILSGRKQYFDWDGDGIDELRPLNSPGAGSYESAYTYTIDNYREVELRSHSGPSTSDILVDYNLDGLIDRLIPMGFWTYKETGDGDGVKEFNDTYWLLEVNSSTKDSYSSKVLSEPNQADRYTPDSEHFNELGIFGNLDKWTTPGDINGDGLTEYAGKYLGEEQLNTGLDLAFIKHNYQVTNPNLTTSNQRLRGLVDLNGDKKSDAVYAIGNSLYWNKSLKNSFGGYQRIATFPSWGTFSKNAKYQFADIDGDEQPELVYYDSSAQKVRVRFDANTSNKVQDKLISVTAGLGKSYGFSYKRLNDGSVYTASTDANSKNWGNGSKVRDITSSMAVVSEYQESTTLSESGLVLFDTTSYRYEGFKSQAGGKGGLGFRKVISTQSSTGIQTEKRFRQDTPYDGKLDWMRTSKGNITLTVKNVTEWQEFDVNDSLSRIALPKKTVTKTYFPNVIGGDLIDSSLAQEEVETNEYSLSQGGYPLLESRTLSKTDKLLGGWQSKKVTNRYDYEDIDNWLVNRVSNVIIEYTRSSSSKVVQEKSYTYYTNSGAKETEIIEPQSVNTSLYLKKHFVYDNFGNMVQETSCSFHYSSSCSSTSVPDTTGDTNKVFNRVIYNYDASSRFILGISNGLFNLKKFEDYNKFGLPTRVYDNYKESSEGSYQEQYYDELGEVYYTFKNDGSSSTITKIVCDTNRVDCPSNASYLLEQLFNDKPNKKTFYDFSGNEVRSAIQLIDGSWTYTDTIYDNRGRAYKVSAPYKNENSVPGWTVTEIDEFDRKVSVNHAHGLSASFTYSSGTITQETEGMYYGETTANLGRVRSEVRNGFSELVSTTDPNNGITSYEYDSLGNIHKVTGVDNKATVIEYDILGRRVKLSDVDKGTILYGVNALGDEVTRTSPDSIVKKDYRNAAGQIKTTTLKNASKSITYRFEYDNELLKSEISDGSTKVFSYDSLNRLSKKEFYLDDKYWESEIIYDDVGRIFREMDISGDGRGVQYQYSFGHLDRIFEVKTGKAYYRATQMDAHKNVIEATVADGISIEKSYETITGRLKSLQAAYGLIQNESYGYDQLGNLRHRINYHGASGTLKETFNYDELNRLTDVYFNGINTQSIQYYDNGNISRKSNVENNSLYYYGEKTSSCSITPGAHAVSRVGNRVYCYDVRGNQVKEFKGASLIREVQYSLFDKATRVWSKNGESLFSYDAKSSRYKRVDTESGKTTITYYVGGNEVIYHSDSTSEIKRYIQDIAIQNIKSTGQEELFYTFKDHLGSGNIFTDKNGTIKAKMSFDAFGKRRNATTWSNYTHPYSELSDLSLLRGITQKGFTGHIQVDHANVIDMGGRIYDPELGRFMQADPIIQDVRDAQSINRYSYVYNNPLSYTDPTGYECVNENAPMCASAMDNLEKESAEAASENVGNSANAEVDSANSSNNKSNSADGAQGNNSSNDSSSSFWDKLQTGLDIVGMVPIVGEVADLANAGISLARGDYEGAALSMAAMVPIAGNAAGAVKIGRRINNAVSDTAKVSARGMNNPRVKAAAARGREEHKKFAEKVNKKSSQGWRSEETIIGPNGEKLRPDAISPSGRPVELKPNTPSGRRQGARQLKKYEEALGKKGRIVYYEP